MQTKSINKLAIGLLLVGILGVIFRTTDVIPPISSEGSVQVVVVEANPLYRSYYPSDMVSSWHSAETRDYAKTHCKSGTILFVTPQQEMANVPPEVVQLLQDYPPKRYPWCYVARTDGSGGIQGDPPEDFVSAISRYGGK